MTTIIETQRLILRTWKHSDLDLMLEINQDPKVMEYFPSLQDLSGTKKLIDKINTHFSECGYSLYAVQTKDTDTFIGFIGLLTANFKASFTPATEIGWRLSSKHWNKGYATEGAKSVLDYAFNSLNIPEIISFTSIENTKSTRVMEKIGLKHNPSDDFDNPNLPSDSPLLRHVLYRLKKIEYHS
jgi:RimJ/RimL family protein N-acetyltransferase